jgi:ubiquinone/menaquinone biosynthesis C-methylase UbiE
MRSLFTKLSGQQGDKRAQSTPAADITTSTQERPQSDEEYWTTHNVTKHHGFKDVSDSLDFLSWRDEQYFDFKKLMPVSGFDGLTILDFGCGPGHDLVGFSLQSKPNRLIGVDVSTTSLAEAKSRLQFHGVSAELYRVDVQKDRLPLADKSVDLVRACGVIQHMAEPDLALCELRRVLKPFGTIQILAYERQSIWYHLYVPYVLQIEERQFTDLSTMEAFAKSTDGLNCPHSRCYTKHEHIAWAESFGFKCEAYGVAVSCWEMIQLPKRFAAIMDRGLAKEHREFLTQLTFDGRGLPMHGEHFAGIDGCYRFKAV